LLPGLDRKAGIIRPQRPEVPLIVDGCGNQDIVNGHAVERATPPAMNKNRPVLVSFEALKISRNAQIADVKTLGTAKYQFSHLFLPVRVVVFFDRNRKYSVRKVLNLR